MDAALHRREGGDRVRARSRDDAHSGGATRVCVVRPAGAPLDHELLPNGTRVVPGNRDHPSRAKTPSDADRSRAARRFGGARIDDASEARGAARRALTPALPGFGTIDGPLRLLRHCVKSIPGATSDDQHSTQPENSKCASKDRRPERRVPQVNRNIGLRASISVWFRPPRDTE